jgi:drug/metabolite transporter (DMT)-like permease
LIYVLFFVAVTAVWGWTFVVVKNAISQYPTLPFLQLRFLLAFLVMVILVRRLPTRKELLVGLLVGTVLAAGYLTQTVGLSLITPGNAGLITGVVLAGQRFGLLQAAGAALVLAAIVGHELGPLKFKTPEHEPIET